VLKTAECSRLGAHVVLCLMTGIRTEEARALRWDHVNLDAASIAVWRAGAMLETCGSAGKGRDVKEGVPSR
jgi:integrase